MHTADLVMIYNAPENYDFVIVVNSHHCLNLN